MHIEKWRKRYINKIFLLIYLFDQLDDIICCQYKKIAKIYEFCALCSQYSLFHADYSRH